MIRTTTCFLVQLFKIVKFQLVYNCINNPNRIIFSYIFVKTLWGKENLFGIVRAKVFVCITFVFLIFQKGAFLK